MQDEGGKLVVVAGPSGVGKGTLVKRICDRYPEQVQLSVSATTRPPRAEEQEGVDYFFWTREQFLEKVKAGELLEWAEYAGNLYGTPRLPVEQGVKQGKVVLLEIEVEGSRQVVQNFPLAKRIFIMPPSLSVLEQRLRQRSTETETSIQKRLARAREEIACADEFDLVILNDDLETATKELETAIFNQRAKEVKA
ncbi:MAG: guanylate kinase [Pseudanabaenaceae cyanobacterium]